MRRSLLIVAVVALAAAVVVPTAGADRLDVADQGGRGFTVALTGAAERPGPGDPDGTGTAELTLNPGQEELCFELTVENVEGIFAAHVHRAPVTAPGPIVVGLAAPTDGFSTGCVTADRALLVDIIQNPENYYVNVHAAPTYQAGAVRGQLG